MKFSWSKERWRGAKIRVDYIDVGEDVVSARTVEAMVFTDDATPGPGIDGLLGLSFLSRFAVTIDDDRLVIGAR